MNVIPFFNKNTLTELKTIVPVIVTYATFTINSAPGTPDCNATPAIAAAAKPRANMVFTNPLPCGSILFVSHNELTLVPINKNDRIIPTTSAFVSEISNNIPMYTKKNVFRKNDT